MENYRISTCHKNIFCLCHSIVKSRRTTKPVLFMFWAKALSAPWEAGGCCKAMGRSPGPFAVLDHCKHCAWAQGHLPSQSLLGWTSAGLKEIKGKAALPNHRVTTQCWRRTLKSQCLCKCWFLSAWCCFETCIFTWGSKKKKCPYLVYFYFNYLRWHKRTRT